MERKWLDRYTKLKSLKKRTASDKLKLEMDWISLYKELKRSSVRSKKKNSIQIKLYKERSLEQAKELSKEIFFMLLRNHQHMFEQLYTENFSLYLRSGVRGLIENYLDQIKSPLNFDYCLENLEKRNHLTDFTNQEWEEAVGEIVSRSFAALSESFAVEKEITDLFYWWDAKKERLGKQELRSLQGTHNLLLSHMEKLSNHILSLLGYDFEISPYTKKKRYRNHLRTHGILSTLQMLEEDEEISSPMIEKILSHIQIVHPKDEFPLARKMKRHFILHVGPTNSGKTFRAIERLKQAESGFYLAPRRLLALEIFEKLTRNHIPCNLVTGDSEIITEGSKHTSSTIEMAAINKKVDVAVIDEFQMIDDPKRGFSWVRAIFGLQANEIHLCGAPYALDFVLKLINECGDTYEVHHHERQTPLIVEEEEFVFPDSIRPGDALIVFSKSKALEVSEEIKKAGINASIIYGKLPAETRKRQVRMFSSHTTDVVIATDAIGIGLNLPIKRVVFLETEKFDGNQKRKLTTQEVKQIAGRAGRKNIYEVGYVNAVSDKEFIKSQLDTSEEPITQSVIMPMTSITELPIGTLRQRLKAWQQSEVPVPYLEKADISDQLYLLKQIEKWEHEIDKEILFKVLYIPFDSKEKQLLNLWSSYVQQVRNGKEELQKPKFLGKTLTNLEIYYHQLNLYYNFSKKFNLKMESKWLFNEKSRTAHNISRSIQDQRKYA